RWLMWCQALDYKGRGFVVSGFFSKKLATTVACASALLASTAIATAQTAPQIVVPHIVLGDLQNVASPPPEAQGADYAAKGLPLGAFRLFPTLDLGFDFDDNIYRTNTGEVSDTIFEFSPRAELQSNWSQHYLAVHGGLTGYEYADRTKESRVDWD